MVFKVARAEMVRLVRKEMKKFLRQMAAEMKRDLDVGPLGGRLTGRKRGIIGLKKSHARRSSRRRRP